MSDAGEQGELWGDPDQLRGRMGPVEKATRQALAAAKLDATKAGTSEALCALAWALDAAQRAGKFYGVAQAGGPYLDTARALGLVVAEQSDDPARSVEEFLRGIANPT